MNQHLKNLEDVFWQAKNLDPGNVREAFVRKLESRDAELAAELKQLLADDAKSDQVFGGLSALDGPANNLAETADSAAPMGPPRGSLLSLRSGSRIGPYKLLEPIGEGGMGLVYLAQQSEPVRRKVALKIIKPGMDSRQVVARFEAERQALAMMDHPNIAKVLDAGTTETGLPYFVMELVRGIPMTDYCDRAKMPTRARLELFQHACTAIQHAHNKGVIHRDIKPSNILVTEQDGKPLVKVIDFGVAKALTDNLTDKTLFTGMFQMLGTPLYMSPEQASLSNVDVDTRSDVYSLGVMLYELLSGALPIDREEVKDLSLEELRQRICDTEPPKPSKRLSTLKDDRETVAECRGVDAKTIQRLITSELDWIVMKALEKERNRRYQSARELAEDIARYLEGEAVEACPPSASYRLRKFVSKNRVAVLVIMTVLLSAISVASVSVWQTYRATLAEKKATDESERLQAVVDFLVDDLLGSADPERSGGSDVTVSEVMANARATIDDALSQDPTTSATIRHTLARTYFRLGEYEEAADLASDASTIWKETLGDQNGRTLESLNILGKALFSSGDKKSIDVFREIYAARKQTEGPRSRATLIAHMNLVVAQLSTDDRDAAVSDMREISSDAEELFGKHDSLTLVSKSNLVEGLYLQTKYLEASSLLSQILESVRKNTDRRIDLDFMHLLRNMAKLQTKLGRYAEAEANLRSVVDVQRRVLPSTHPQLYLSIRQLAECLREQQLGGGKATELLQLLKEWEAIATELYGENSEAAWQARLIAVDTDRRSGPFTREAREAIVERLTDILEQPAQKLSLGSGVRCEAMQLKAFVLNDLRRYDEAVSLHSELVAELEKRYPENHDRILHGRYDLAFALMNAGKEVEAEEILRGVFEQSKELLGEDHPHTLRALRQLGRALFRQKKFLEAAQIYEDTILIRKNSPLYVSQPIDIRDYGTLGTCYLVLEQFSKAEVYLRAVVANPGVKKSARFSLALNNYVACLQKQRKFDQVLATIEQYLTREFLREIERVLDARDIEHVDIFLRDMGKLLSMAAWDLAVREDVSAERRFLAMAYGELATKLKEDSGYLNNYGVALFQNGEYAKAIDVFEKADSMIDGGDRAHRMFLAMAQWHVGNHEEARDFYQQGLAWQESQTELDEVQQRFRKMAEKLMEIQPGADS